MEQIAVIDFGSQYAHLISRRIKDLGVYASVFPVTTSSKDLKHLEGLKGIILSGGAASVYDPEAPVLDKEILDLGVPVLGICYGHQIIAFAEHGNVKLGDAGEYGPIFLAITKESKLLEGCSSSKKVWMNHRDIVASLPEGYETIASTKHSSIAAFQNTDRQIYGVQFHPEVSHTENGLKILSNFVFTICNAKITLTTDYLIESIKREIAQALGNKRALIGLSGGIDSSTAAMLVSQVIKDNLVAVYVDTGLMREKETEFIKDAFAPSRINLKTIHAEGRFFQALRGITEPEQKRKIIGKLFIDIFTEIAEKEKAEVIIQGTIYSDRIESGITQHSSIIKSHHNVGGLPAFIKLPIYEPLRDLYKDEVRKIAKKIGLPQELFLRQVFPGPGLAIRIIGEVTPERAEITRKSSAIVEAELKKAGLYDRVWMAFAVMLPIQSVGIQGDSRTYKYPIVIRIIESKDAMTANFAKIPYEILENISTRITNEISSVNRVVYDISNKPPATMEWE